MNSEPYRNCTLCPRLCRVDRTAGRRGVCGETAVCRVASATAHFGEEPSFTGTRGSGTIFFTGCSSHCFFCQNFQISAGGQGREVTPEQLLDMALSLVGKGVHNLNFVSPDHVWPHVEWVCRQLRERGVTLPFLFNTSGYQDPARVPGYAALIDIFLPDYKFADPALARVCMRDEHYPEIALKAIREMVARKGFLTPWDPEGRETARQGVLVRHLVLPGCVENSLAAIRTLHAAFGPDLPVSIMSQFKPVPGCREKGMLERGVTDEEYEQVTDLVAELGFERAYIQPGAGDDDFLPDFNEEEPFEGNRNRRDSSEEPAS
jgi:putative pyruvate formate lyase activating enzyme